ncbi:B3 domain-containing protein [Hordeum vulgare]|nr:B3 domain-containing protein [Hordeum vulgare]
MPCEMADLEGIEFFRIILEKSSNRQVLPDNFVKMLDGHRPQNVKLWQAGNELHRLWDVEVLFDTDGSMYLDSGWKQFVRAYDLWHGYFLLFRYDDKAMFTVKVFDTTMCCRCYHDDDDASNGSRSSEYCNMCYRKSSIDPGYSKSSSDSGYSKSSSEDEEERSGEEVEQSRDDEESRMKRPGVKKTASKKRKSSEASVAMPPGRVMAPSLGQTKRILEPDEPAPDRFTGQIATMAAAADH